MADLKRPAFSRIAIANPETAPYGAAAREAISTSGLAETLQPKLIIAENVRQAFQYVKLGEVDAAFVSASLIGEERRSTFLVPEWLHQPLLQAAAPLKNSAHSEDAKRFIEFLVSDSGRALLTNHGLDPPPSEAVKK